MNKLELYTPDTTLAEDEYLLKIKIGAAEFPPTGFMTKLNKDDSMPVMFKDWNNGDNLPIYKVKEEFRSGWELLGWRFGESRNWAILIHPQNYTVEIHLEKFLNIVQENTIIDGVIQGEFKWVKTKLIKK